MPLTDAAAAWPKIASKELVIKGLLALFLYQVIRFFYNGLAIRLKFRQLRAQGHHIFPHSSLLGHLPLIQKLGATLPADANNVYSTRDLATNWQHYLPDAATAPGVVYLDLWPVAAAPVLILKDPALAAQLVAARFPPRHEQAKYLARAVAGVRNLFEWDGDEHRAWRARLNPGFSTRSLQVHVAKGRMVEQARTFGERMRSSAGANGAWGKPFQVFPRAVDLTFDVIVAWMVPPSDFSPDEQTNGPTEMQKALRILGTEYMMFSSLLTLHKQLNPFWHLKYYRCHRTLRRILLPHIQKSLDVQTTDSKDPSAPRTVVDLALQELQQEGSSSKSRESFIEDVIGLTKQFIFAGHETTAITLSFAIHYLSKNSEALQKIRDEHDGVFGQDPSKVADQLRAAPHLLASLPYTTAAVKETLRLTAIASAIREAPPNCILSDPSTGVQFPAANFILVSGIRSIHSDAAIFPRPTEFLPQRWLVGDDDPLHAKTEGHVWRPFELGPMACIGQELAMMELKMALLFTAREFEFEAALEEWDAMQGKNKGPRPTVDSDNIYQSNASPLGPPVEGLPMRVRLRSRS